MKYFVGTLQFYIDSLNLASYIIIYIYHDVSFNTFYKSGDHIKEAYHINQYFRIVIYIILGVKSLQTFGKISNGFNYIYKINRSLLDGKNLMYYFELLITIIRLIVLQLMILYMGTSMYMYFSDRIEIENNQLIKELMNSMNKLSKVKLDTHKDIDFQITFSKFID